jgi:uncharacterized protein YcsI (UPF0317 family)
MRPYWTADTVGFLIGCSFSWEHALAAAGLPPRHLEKAKAAEEKATEEAQEEATGTANEAATGTANGETAGTGLAPAAAMTEKAANTVAKTVPMFRTAIANNPVGRFQGVMVNKRGHLNKLI